MKTVFVGLSGGVDSSVTALLLKEQGYRVVGVYMKNWTADIAGLPCPWQRDFEDAKAVAARLDIELRVLDFQDQYRQQVVDYMVAEYRAGRTPNPDIMCNQEIKFKLFLEACMSEGADLIATGHYARTHDGQLLTALDATKDQTYFLYRVSKSALARTLFPLGDLKKSAVRELAQTAGLVTANKPDSQGICFVGEVGVRPFLQQYIAPHPGPIVVKATGQIVGEHDGAEFYTIGQRHGLRVGGGKPYYVLGKDMTTNTLYVTDDPVELDFDSAKFMINDCHWIDSEPDEHKNYQIRQRHGGKLSTGTLTRQSGGWQVKLAEPVRALAPGQSAVVYDGELVLGGGIIQ